ALSMFYNKSSFNYKKLTYLAFVDNLNVLYYDYYFKITDHIAQENVPDTLLVFDEIISGGFEGNHFISGLASHFRNLLISKEPKTVQLLEVSENIKKKYLEQSSALSTGLLLSALNIANHCEVNYRTSNNKRLQVELALMKMCHIASALLLSDKTIESQASEVKKKRLKTAEKEYVETKPKAAETEKVEEKAVSFSTAKKNEENKTAAIAQQKPAVKQTLQEDAQKQPSVAAAATVQEKTTAKPGWGTVKSRLNVPD